MIFEFDGTVVTLDQPAQYPTSENTELVQAKERTASGLVQVEDFDVKIGTYTYNFVDMSNADYLLLMSFFVNNAQGMMNEFLLTDDFSVQRTVRFTTASLSFTSNAYLLWNGSFTVEVVQ